MMHTQRQIDHLQAQRASEWFDTLKQGRAEDMVAFQEWCRKSPLHIQEFLEITSTDRALDELNFETAESAADLTALLRKISNAGKIAPTPADIESTNANIIHSKRRPRRYWAAAATVATFALGLMLFRNPWPLAEEFSTKIGEQRTVELLDASVVTLNTDSDIRVQFERDGRDIDLLHGEAVFKVVHDPTRPFRVHTRAGVVQAVGTEFNVYDRPEGTDITVLEGRVRLTAHPANGSGAAAIQELVAGEKARIALSGDIQRAEQADIARVTAWSKRRLKFHNESLEEIALEFNRYHRDLRLRVQDVPANSRHYSGIFDANDPETLARFLERESDLIVERSEREIVIRAR